MLWWINENASKATEVVTSTVVFICLRNDESSKRLRHPSQKKPPGVITATHVWFALPKKGLSWRAQRASITYLRVPVRRRPVGEPQPRPPKSNWLQLGELWLQITGWFLQVMAKHTAEKKKKKKKRGINLKVDDSWPDGQRRCCWVLKTGLHKLNDLCVKLTCNAFTMKV